MNKEKLAEAERKLRWALHSQSVPRIRAMLDLARSDPRIAATPDIFDRDPTLFNCPNGTLDLQTGRLREHRREEYITQLCPTRYLPDAMCPRFERFMEEIFPLPDGSPDRELIVYMQRLLGRCLSGDVSEQILPIFWGDGGNGKSVLVDTLMHVLGGDYSLKLDQDFLMISAGERHLTAKASLWKKRFVVASETPQGRRLNESLVKDLTGGEPIRCRRMREDEWQFLPTHKIFLLTNHRPEISGRDRGIWRRCRLIPFVAEFATPESSGDAAERVEDKGLAAKLRTESEGILAWLAAGCREWRTDGLQTPGRVLAATDAYRADENVIGRFVDEKCVRGDDSYRVRSSALYSAYRSWCDATGERPLRQNLFTPELQRSGIKKLANNGVWLLGVALRDDD